MPDSDAARARFSDLVRARGQRTHFIDEDAEAGLLEEGVTRFDLSLTEARGLILGAARDDNIAVESDVVISLKRIIRRNLKAGRRLTREAFERMVSNARALSNEAWDDATARVKVKSIVDDSEIVPRGKGLFRRLGWYDKAGERNAKPDDDTRRAT